MKKRPVGYVTFNSNDVFLKWQDEHEDYDIVAIMPLVSGLKMQFAGQEEAEGTTGIGAFITFLYP